MAGAAIPEECFLDWLRTHGCGHLPTFDVRSSRSRFDSKRTSDQKSSTLLLTSDSYLHHLREMLLEASPRAPGKGPRRADIEEMLRILAERKAFFETRRPHVVSLVGHARD
ncbi:hypothetical protein [Variovorax sp. MHTC-1]|uniref:hypothetical protein n=1 Tax=Variovorax sp. MHTC-1 TaxID=2495593 RepID=UPI000F88930D|nr:hypothetical protein [Variovorax sp. MHTC-1]RST50048.1 hypothetical protein EJI01_22690 [Variovorax sp. MHTC-1]